MTFNTQHNYVNSSEANFTRDARLRSLAMNAVREALVAFGRSDSPYTDNDAVIMENIFVSLQGIGEEAYLVRQNEHQPLAVADSKPSATASKVAEALGLLTDIPKTEEPVNIRTKLPLTLK